MKSLYGEPVVGDYPWLKVNPDDQAQLNVKIPAYLREQLHYLQANKPRGSVTLGAFVTQALEAAVREEWERRNEEQPQLFARKGEARPIELPDADEVADRLASTPAVRQAIAQTLRSMGVIRSR